ncbi:arsenate reductase [Thalassospiraceae bacterium LMO-JJ14]|nr:arsenate reductase [Thalassospiraceae bacterium LMO-JJ14]
MLKMYGLKNCDTCRKAVKWLGGEGIDHEFIDVRKDGISEADIAEWAASAGVDSLLNRRGTTWRGLSEADKAKADDGGAIALMATYPALIKRPVFNNNGDIRVGFKTDEQDWLKA